MRVRVQVGSKSAAIEQPTHPGLGQPFAFSVAFHSLLLAFVCLAGAAMFVGLRRETVTIWQNVNTHLAAANNGGG